MVDSAQKWKLAYAEYVAREEASDLKHEFIDGEVFAMAGGSPEHAALIAAVNGVLFGQLHKGPCRAFVTELRTRIRADGELPDVGTYPDIAVVCGLIARDPEDPHSIVNPTLIIEVLSPSTEAYDRQGKFEHYKRLESLREYVLVSQRTPRIERFSKSSGGWATESDAAGSGERLTLVSLRATLDVDDIYAGLVDDSGRVTLG